MRARKLFVGRQIREIRQANGLTQAVFAERLGISTSYLNQLENNLQFFSNVKDDNPLVKEVHKNIEKYRNELDIWKQKLRKIRTFY